MLGSNLSVNFAGGDYEKGNKQKETQVLYQPSSKTKGAASHGVNTDKVLPVEPKSNPNPLVGGNDALKAMKEKIELKMKLTLTQKLLDKTMNEYKFLKDETIRKEQLQKEN